MVVFVLMRIHELVDVFAGPGVLVLVRGCDGFRRPCLPLVAEPCVEPWDVAGADLAVVDGMLVAAQRGLEPGELTWFPAMAAYRALASASVLRPFAPTDPG